MWKEPLVYGSVYQQDDLFYYHCGMCTVSYCSQDEEWIIYNAEHHNATRHNMNLYLVIAYAPLNEQVFTAVVGGKNADEAIETLKNYTAFKEDKLFRESEFTFDSFVISLPGMSQVNVEGRIYIYTSR